MCCQKLPLGWWEPVELVELFRLGFDGPGFCSPGASLGTGSLPGAELGLVRAVLAPERTAAPVVPGVAGMVVWAALGRLVGSDGGESSFPWLLGIC